MERKAGRMGAFWAPNRERQTSLKKRKKQAKKKKKPSSFPVGTESIRKQKAEETN